MSIEQPQKSSPELGKIITYFTDKLEVHGATPRGVDYNSVEAQEIRFSQLINVVDSSQKYSLLDFGSGFGGMYDYLLRIGHNLHYVGYDIAEPMVLKGRDIHPNNPDCQFTSSLDEIPVLDYGAVSGTFNMKLDVDYDVWTNIVLDALSQINNHTTRGFAFNMLTKYSDADRMAQRPDLYYADPLFFFDYCKRNFSRNIALLHDYEIYDFTILVRKDI